MKKNLKAPSVILAVICFFVLTVALLFGCFGASLDSQAQKRISDDASGWQMDNGGFIFDITMKLVSASFENRLVCVCIGILTLLTAGIIAMRLKKSFLYIGIPAAVSGGLIAVVGLALKLLYDFLIKAAPAVDWIWYKTYLFAFQNRLLLCGGITLAIGIVLIVLKYVLARKGREINEG